VNVEEVACGDPSCAPIDTVFTLVWQSGGKGVFALPMLASEVTKDDLIDMFPVRRRTNVLTTFRIRLNLRLLPVPCMAFSTRMRTFCGNGTPERRLGGPGYQICGTRWETASNAALARTP
jgi:hypothetical protein